MYQLKSRRFAGSAAPQQDERLSSKNLQIESRQYFLAGGRDIGNVAKFDCHTVRGNSIHIQSLLALRHRRSHQTDGFLSAQESSDCTRLEVSVFSCFGLCFGCIKIVKPTCAVSED